MPTTDSNSKQQNTKGTKNCAQIFMVLSMPFAFYKITSTNVYLCSMLNVRHCLFDVLNPNNTLYNILLGFLTNMLQQYSARFSN